jgi:hypothetical protein
MDENTTQFAALLLADGWILDDLPDLLVKNPFLLFPETANSLLEGTGLDDSHGASPKLVFRGLALIQFLNTDQDVLYHAVGQFGILFRTLPDSRPMLDLAGDRTVVNSADKARLAHKVLRYSNSGSHCITSISYDETIIQQTAALCNTVLPSSESERLA